MLSKKFIIILAVVVLVLLAFGVWLGMVVVGGAKPNPSRPSEYSAVYLTTGDIYYGKLDWFPWPRLKNAWVLQRPASPGGQFGIIQFTQALWQPIDEVYLNPQQIVFWTRLRSDSKLIDYFNNPALLGGVVPPPAAFQVPPVSPPSSVPASPATSTH